MPKETKRVKVSSLSRQTSQPEVPTEEQRKLERETGKRHRKLADEIRAKSAKKKLKEVKRQKAKQRKISAELRHFP